MELLLEVLDAEETSEGYYTGWAIVGGEGIRDYRDKYGVLMYCPASELFSKETMESAKLLPITHRHPSQDVDAENWNDLSIGVTGENPERRGNKLAFFFKITAAWAIEEIRKLKEAGKPILFSLGYKILPDKTPGTWMGKAYQWVMRRIRYNHLALLLDNSTPRHDGTGEINDSQKTDGELLLLADSFSSNKPQEGLKVKKKIPGSGIEIEIQDSDARYFDNFVTEHTNQANELSEAKGEIKQLERDLEKAKTNVTDSKAFEKAFNERFELALEAVDLLDSVDVKELAKMSPLEIKEEVLIADGYTRDELKDLREEEGEQYAATVGGIYRRIAREAGSKESQNIHDSASRAATKSAAKGGQIVISDSKIVEARKRVAERNGGKK